MIRICNISPSVGRKKQWPDKMVAALGPGTLGRMEAVLSKGESKTDLVRMAIERELARRSALAKRKQADE